MNDYRERKKRKAESERNQESGILMTGIRMGRETEGGRQREREREGGREN